MSAAASLPIPKTTILVVDDERNIRRTLRMVLEGAGFEVAEAESAEAGLLALDELEVDLIILYTHLPKTLRPTIDLMLSRAKTPPAWAAAVK